MCGMASFRIAVAPSAHSTGATQAQLTSAQSIGGPSDIDQRRSRSRRVDGSRRSQAARSAVLLQFAASWDGIGIGSTGSCPTIIVHGFATRLTVLGASFPTHVPFVAPGLARETSD